MIKSQVEIVAHDTIKRKDKTVHGKNNSPRKGSGPMKKHSILTWFCLLVSLLLLLAGCTDSVSSTPETLCGTYTSGDAELQKIFSVDQSNAFYYADQKNDRFILGQLQPQGEDAYLLSCQDPNNAAILPDQEFTYDGKGFSITIQDELYVFQKTGDIPSIIGDTTRYS